jgi:hypothetical protein
MEFMGSCDDLKYTIKKCHCIFHKKGMFGERIAAHAVELERRPEDPLLTNFNTSTSAYT